MKPCTLIVPLLSALGVVCVNVHPVRGENSLAVAIAELDQLRYGGSPDFGEVERRGRELLGKYSQPEEQAQIYYALSHLYIQSSTKHYDLVIDYATRGLRLPLPDEQRLRLFVYLGDALRSENFGKKPFPEIRKMAVVPYLEGLKEAQRLRAQLKGPRCPWRCFSTSLATSSLRYTNG